MKNEGREAFARLLSGIRTGLPESEIWGDFSACVGLAVREQLERDPEPVPRWAGKRHGPMSAPPKRLV
jgi:hypothetical protein